MTMVSRKPSFSITLSRADADALARVSGTLGWEAAPRLQEALAGLVNDGVRRLVLDLGGVDDLHLASLSALIGVVQRLDTEGGKVTLRNVPRKAVATLQAAKIPLAENGVV
jgi:anti-anti-sigma regulatory factor